jgi:hypothetical protein
MILKHKTLPQFIQTQLGSLGSSQSPLFNHVLLLCEKQVIGPLKALEVIQKQLH